MRFYVTVNYIKRIYVEIYIEERSRIKKRVLSQKSKKKRNIGVDRRDTINDSITESRSLEEKIETLRP